MGREKGVNEMNHRTMAVLMALIMFVAFQGKAEAFNFTLGSYQISLNDSDPGLVLHGKPILEQPYTYHLNVGESIHVPLFEISTNESYANLDDLFWKEIFVTFDFSAPDVADAVEGQTRGRWFFQDGVVRWNGPRSFSFGDAGSFSVALMDTEFGLPGFADVWATIRYDREGVGAAPVPEPATILMLGSGFMGLGWVLRRKKAMKEAGEDPESRDISVKG